MFYNRIRMKIFIFTNPSSSLPLSTIRFAAHYKKKTLISLASFSPPQMRTSFGEEPVQSAAKDAPKYPKDGRAGGGVDCSAATRSSSFRGTSIAIPNHQSPTLLLPSPNVHFHLERGRG